MQAFFKDNLFKRFTPRRAAWGAVFLALGLYVLFLFADFAMDTREIFLDAGPIPAKADAIVVLTGGKGRIPEGAALLRSKAGRVLIVSGVAVEASLDSIFGGRLTKAELNDVILEKKSRSTYENALEARRLIEERGFKSVILLTSVYHMKRAFYIFRHVMPADITIKPYFVTTANFNENRWWGYKSVWLLVVEFVKYNWYGLRFALESA